MPRDVMSPVRTLSEIGDNLFAVVEAYDRVGVNLHTIRIVAMSIDARISEMQDAREEMKRGRLVGRDSGEGSSVVGGDTDGDDFDVPADGEGCHKRSDP